MANGVRDDGKETELRPDPELLDLSMLLDTDPDEALPYPTISSSYQITSNEMIEQSITADLVIDLLDSLAEEGTPTPRLKALGKIPSLQK